MLQILTVNSICSFGQCNSIWGGWYHPPPKISENTERMTLKFLPDVKLGKEARNQKKISDFVPPH